MQYEMLRQFIEIVLIFSIAVPIGLLGMTLLDYVKEKK
jgi:hypothetical protein